MSEFLNYCHTCLYEYHPTGDVRRVLQAYASQQEGVVGAAADAHMNLVLRDADPGRCVQETVKDMFKLDRSEEKRNRAPAGAWRLSHP